MQLSRPERRFLSWFSAQAAPVTMEEIAAAPCFDRQRMERLRRRGFIVCVDQNLAGDAQRTYAITDEGRAALESDRMMLASDRRSKIALVVSILALGVSVFALLQG